MSGPKRISFSDVKAGDLPEFELPIGSGKFYPIRGFRGDLTLEEKQPYEELLGQIFKPDAGEFEQTGEGRKARAISRARERANLIAWWFPTFQDAELLEQLPERYFEKMLDIFISDPFEEIRQAGGTTPTLSTGMPGSVNQTPTSPSN